MNSEVTDGLPDRVPRVLVVSEHSAEGTGGIVTFLNRLVDVALSGGARVSLVTRGGANSQKMLKILSSPSVELLFSGPFVLAFSVFLQRALPRPIFYFFEALQFWLRFRNKDFDRVVFSVASPGRFLFPLGIMRRSTVVLHSEPVGPWHRLVGPW